MQLSRRQRIGATTTSRPFLVPDLFSAYRVLSLVAAAFLLWKFPLPEGLDAAVVRNAASVVASIDATLLGFLVSSAALLYAVANTRLVRNLQRTGHFTAVVRDLFIDSAAFLVCLLVAMVCLVLPDKAQGDGGAEIQYLRMGVHVLMFCNAIAFLLLLPLAKQFWVLLTNLEPDGSGSLE